MKLSFEIDTHLEVAPGLTLKLSFTQPFDIAQLDGTGITVRDLLTALYGDLAIRFVGGEM